ncbi:hypothetical protein [Paenibacillus rigui]|uniref:Uncharacterized protein n=1 Tax=Paenibacillus rigui TaxID=554312 RepID=A0A229UFX2_9BACL|nr:hypothetical protein [Paenibacillus rigui]OXM82280.1 hypothetical protein CF651_31775 [Paenibacillus rigui]
MTRLFLVRKYYINGPIHEEGIFNSFNKAEEFVKQISAVNPNKYIYSIGRIIINSVYLNSFDPWDDEMKWEYDIKGNLCRKFVNNNGWNYESEWKINGNSFSLGDIVFVMGNLKNPYAYTNEDIIGVIADVPKTLDEWNSLGYSDDEWKKTYLIDYVNSSGYFTHCHVDEEGIFLYEQSIPEDLAILQSLSDHYKGLHKIDYLKLNNIRDKKIFIKGIS